MRYESFGVKRSSGLVETGENGIGLGVNTLETQIWCKMGAN